MVAQYGVPVQGIAAQGHYVYVGVGPRLVVLDALDSANIHPIGATAQFDDFVKGVAVSGTLAYLAAGSAGLRVIYVSDPAHPAEIGVWDSPGYAKGVAVDGQTAYLADAHPLCRLPRERTRKYETQVIGNTGKQECHTTVLCRRT